MDTFPPNSQRAKVPDEPKKIEQVTSGEAVRRKKGLGRKFKETFIGGDAKTAAHAVLLETIIPNVQDMMLDAMQGVVEKWIRGETRPRRPRGIPGGYANVGHVDYKGVMSRTNATRSPTQPGRMLSQEARARHDFGDIVIASRGEAEEVIDRMFDILSQYGSVTVSNLYALTGIAGSHTDQKWGWTELKGARAARLRTGGFLLDLPEPEPLG